MVVKEELARKTTGAVTLWCDQGDKGTELPCHIQEDQPVHRLKVGKEVGDSGAQKVHSGLEWATTVGAEPGEKNRGQSVCDFIIPQKEFEFYSIKGK